MKELETINNVDENEVKEAKENLKDDSKFSFSDTLKNVEEIGKKQAEADIDQREDLINNFPDLESGDLKKVYQESKAKKNIAILKAKSEIEGVKQEARLGEDFSQKKETILAKLKKADNIETLNIKEEYKQLIEEKSLELAENSEKTDVFKFVLHNLDEFNKAELDKKSFFVKTVNKISDLTNKYLYIYIPQKIKDSRYGNYVKYTGAAAIGTALVATIAPSTVALGSLGIGGYFGLKLAKKVIGATVGGLAGAGAAKLYDKLINEKKEKTEQELIDKAIEDKKPFSDIVNLIDASSTERIKRENNKLKLVLLAGISVGFTTYGALDSVDDLLSNDNSNIEDYSSDHKEGNLLKDSAKNIYDKVSIFDKIMHKIKDVLGDH